MSHDRLSAYLAELGYQVRDLVLDEEPGIDLLGERADGLTTVRVGLRLVAGLAVAADVDACAAARDRLRLQQVILVAADGVSPGVADAARAQQVEVWGPEELADRVGSRRAPELVPGAAFVITPVDARVRFAAVSKRAPLVRMAAVHLPLVALTIRATPPATRSEPDPEERRFHNAYEAVTGGFYGRPTHVPTTLVDVGGGALRPRLTSEQFRADVEATYARWREKRRRLDEAVIQSLGIPVKGAAVFEAATLVWHPVHLGFVQGRRGTEVLVVDGLTGEVAAALASTLTDHVAWVEESLR